MLYEINVNTNPLEDEDQVGAYVEPEAYVGLGGFFLFFSRYTFSS